MEHSAATWTSNLGVDEFACVRLAGFEPLGQVMGATVFNHVWQGKQSFCRGGATPPYSVVESPRPRTDDKARRVARVDQLGGWVDAWFNALRDVRHRIAAGCAELGGDGVIGVRVEEVRFEHAPHLLGLRAIGTALRAHGSTRAPKPFLGHLSGQEFATLIEAGWVPVDLVGGMAVALLHERSLSEEVPARRRASRWSTLLAETRAECRRVLHEEAEVTGADGVVISDYDLGIRRERCTAETPAHDVVLQSTINGTVIARYTRSHLFRPPMSGSDAILRL